MIKTLLRFIGAHKISFTWATLLGVLTVAANIGLLATSGYLIASAALRPSTVLALWVPIVGVRFFGISRAVFRYGERYFSHDLTFRILARIRTWFYERIEPLAPARLFKFRSGDVLSGIVADVDTLQDFYLRALAPPLVAVFILVFVVVLLSYFSPKLGLMQGIIMVLAGVGVPVFTFVVGRRVGAKVIQLRSEFAGEFVDQMQGLADVLAFSQEEKAITRLNEISQGLVKQQGKLARINGLTGGLMTFFNHLSMLVLLLIAIPLVVMGVIKGVDLAVIAQTALASFEAIIPLPLAFQQLGKSFAAMQHLLDLLNAKPEIQNVNTDLQFAAVPDLQIEHLTFHYPEETERVVEDISFNLTGGKHLAIVGASGAGKSSLVQILSRFYEYGEGSVMLNGMELNGISSETVHQMIAISPQQPHLFNTSVRENLLLAKPDASREEIEQVAKVALAHDFIENLPEQYDTFVGEQGFRLSGGERQRLAIARTLLANAPIHVFDEPTSGLDALTEANLLTSVHKMLRERSLIWITHRLTGLEIMDEILVMEQGRIVERGKHHQLLELKGLYREMWDIQQQMVGAGIEVA